jgi:hypothetical protein
MTPRACEVALRGDGSGKCDRMPYDERRDQRRASDDTPARHAGGQETKSG